MRKVNAMPCPDSQDFSGRLVSYSHNGSLDRHGDRCAWVDRERVPSGSLKPRDRGKLTVEQAGTSLRSGFCLPQPYTDGPRKNRASQGVLEGYKSGSDPASLGQRIHSRSQLTMLFFFKATTLVSIVATMAAALSIPELADRDLVERNTCYAPGGGGLMTCPSEYVCQKETSDLSRVCVNGRGCCIPGHLNSPCCELSCSWNQVSRLMTRFPPRRRPP